MKLIGCVCATRGFRSASQIFVSANERNHAFLTSTIESQNPLFWGKSIPFFFFFLFFLMEKVQHQREDWVGRKIRTNFVSILEFSHRANLLMGLLRCLCNERIPLTTINFVSWGERKLAFLTSTVGNQNPLFWGISIQFFFSFIFSCKKCCTPNIGRSGWTKNNDKYHLYLKILSCDFFVICTTREFCSLQWILMPWGRGMLHSLPQL